jgi:hypothetical protein
MPVETPGGKAHAAVRTEVAQGKGRAAGVTTDKDRLAEHDLG